MFLFKKFWLLNAVCLLLRLGIFGGFNLSWFYKFTYLFPYYSCMTGDKSNKFFCLPIKNRKIDEASHISNRQANDLDELFETYSPVNCPTARNSVSDNYELINSYVDSCFMPPWEHVIEYKPTGEYEYLNDFINVDELWEDPNGVLELNSSQRSRFFCWIRYFHLCNNLRFFNGLPSSDRILQGYVGDCSTVSSLSSLAEYEKLCKQPVLTDKITLIDLDASGMNLRNLSYPDECINYFKDYKIAIGVKIYFNGCARCMLVDDWVPIRKDNTPLCAHSSDPNELWVTLFEKANVRLIGKSYSIKGTNPGVDIYHLTGWIPEIIQLPPYMYKKPNQDKPESKINLSGYKVNERNDLSNIEKWDGIWNSLVFNFNKDLVVCLGTNYLYDVTTDPNYVEGISVSSGIVSGHAYSVLNLVEFNIGEEKYRLMLLKNPWGKISSKIKIPNEVYGLLPNNNEINKESDDGIFWIEWIEVLKWFSHLYVCWNDKMFKFMDKIHFNWAKNKHFIDSWVPEDSYLSLFNPQILVSCQNKDVVKDNELVCLNENEGDDLVIYAMLIQNKTNLRSKMKYLAIHTFNGNSRVITPNDPLVNGVYSNSEIILNKLLISSENNDNGEKRDLLTKYGKYYPVVSKIGDPKFVLLICHFMKKIKDDKCFTLVIYSNKMVKLQLVPSISSKYNNKVFEYKWTKYTRGMNPNQIWSYFCNPHFRLEISQDTNMIFILETDNEISVNLRAFFGRLATIKALKTRQAMSSNEYKLYCCSIQGFFNKGIYTLIPSNFNGIESKFRFNVFFENGNEDNIKIYPIPYPYINLDFLPNTISINGGNNTHIQGELINGEYKINANDEKMILNNEHKASVGLIDGGITQFVVQKYYHILMTKMVNYYFDFKVKEPCLLSIRIKVSSMDDFKYVLFAKETVNKRNINNTDLNSKCIKFVKPCITNRNINDADPRLNMIDKDNHNNSELNTNQCGNHMGVFNCWSSFCSNVCCVDCGGPCGQFYPINSELFETEHKLGYRFCVFSDLNGGISKNGKTPSNSSHVLFVKDRVVLFTLVDLFPGVEYRLLSMGQFTFQDLILISNQRIIPIL